MRTYRLLGLWLRSTSPIPWLTETEPSAEGITVRWGIRPSGLPLIPEGSPWSVGSETDENHEPSLKLWRTDRGDRLVFWDGVEFLISTDGQEIWCWWVPNLVEEDAAVYLLGPVLGFLLRRSGTTCLHASAVSVDGSAIAFMGPGGAGKSTTAAMFAKRGHAVLSDDVVALTEQGEGFWLVPAWPNLRLWPSSARILFGSEDALPALVPVSAWDKRLLDLRRPEFRFEETPRPLVAVFLLAGRTDDPAAPFLDAPRSSESLMALVANTYANVLLERKQRAAEFDLLARLVTRVPVLTLYPHEDPDRLDRLYETVLGGLARAVRERRALASCA